MIHFLNHALTEPLMNIFIAWLYIHFQVVISFSESINDYLITKCFVGFNIDSCSVVRNNHTYEILNKDYNRHCYFSSFSLRKIKRNQGCRAQSKNPFVNTETFCVWNCLRVTPCVVTLFHSLTKHYTNFISIKMDPI